MGIKGTNKVVFVFFTGFSDLFSDFFHDNGFPSNLHNDPKFYGRKAIGYPIFSKKNQNTSSNSFTSFSVLVLW